METVFDKAAASHTALIRQVLDPANEESPLGRLKSEMLGAIREPLAMVLKQVTEVAANVAAAKATGETFELTAIKGQTFEDFVHAAVSNLAARYGDLAEQVGATPGSKGGKKGDEIVFLNEDDTVGQRAAIVFEAKDRKLSMPKIMEELAQSLTNREALAAVAVFDGQAAAPTAVPFSYWGNRAIVVLERDATDSRLLELAYLWARWEARKSEKVSTNPIDVGAINDAIGQVQRSMARGVTMRKYHSVAARNIGLAGTELDTFVSEVDDGLARLRDLL